MRTKATLLAVALGAVFAATPASAHTCTAEAMEPTFGPAGATGTGSHSWTGPQDRDMTVTVCLEVATAPSLWNSYGCRTYERASTRLVFGSAAYPVCGIPGALLVRTTAYGTTSLGENDYAESLPVSAVCVSN
jgi:hypothetical protein